MIDYDFALNSQSDDTLEESLQGPKAVAHSCQMESRRGIAPLGLRAMKEAALLERLEARFTGP